MDVTNYKYFNEYDSLCRVLAFLFGDAIALDSLQKHVAIPFQASSCGGFRLFKASFAVHQRVQLG